MSTWTLSVNPSTESALPAVDVTVEAQPQATVGDLARALGTHLAPERSGLLVAPVGSGRPWPASQRLSECALRTGDLIDVATVPDSWLERPSSGREVRAVLRVVAGPDSGRTQTLTTPSVVIGRGVDATVRLSDPLVSGRHARLDLTGDPVVVDEGSANGTLVDGLRIARATRVEPGAQVRVGATTFVVEQRVHHDPSSLAVHRSPRFGVPLLDDELEITAAPKKGRPSPLPWAIVAMPMVLGVAMFMMSRSPFALAYIFAWPLVGLGGWWQQRRTVERDHRVEMEAWKRQADAKISQVREQGVLQRERAFVDHPDPADLGVRARNEDGSLWARHPSSEDFLQVRVGRGAVPARLTALLREGGDDVDTESTREQVAATSVLPDTPLPAPLLGAPLLAVVGDDGEVDDALRALITRLCLDHSPSDISVTAVLGAGRIHHESWLRWLPHARPRVGGEPSIAIGAVAGQQLLDRLLAEDGSHGHTLCILDEGAGLHRRAIEAAAEVGAARGLHVIHLGAHRLSVPASTDQLLDLRARELARRERGGVAPLDIVDGMGLGQAWRAARLVTARIDEAAVLPADSALPTLVCLPEVMPDLADLDDAQAVVNRWGMSTGIRAQIGAGVDGVVTIDLREDGPHGLVAGTTGSGKSELLQSLLCSLAANTPPSRITFLLVDYKGGAAFRECADLPHTVGYITDLTPALVQRALTSLSAEISHREELLGEYGAKDLLHLEREHPEVAPPALLICIDEFAALTAEVPEFVEGMVNLAQRGRSLGMHLLLATQRPAGVVTPAIRANTDLRIALRIASDDDSRDVIDTPDAAHISRRTPGRAWVRRTGHGTAEMVQTAWTGARQPLADAAALVGVRPFTATGSVERAKAASERLDPRTDLDRCVRTIAAAQRLTGAPLPRRPWLAMIPSELPLDPTELVAATNTSGQGLLGRLDDPQRQAQPWLRIDYASVGHVLMHGSSGSGKTEALRTVATAVSVVDAHASDSVAPYIYGLDFAGGGLGVLTALPTVAAVITDQQMGRVLRLLRVLRATVEDRSRALAAHGAADIAAFSRQGTVLPRVHLLIDNLTALVEHLEGGGSMTRAHSEMLTAILQNGRRVGVHVTAAMPGRSGIPTSLGSAFGTRLVLRMPTADDYLMLGVPANLLSPDSLPGSVIQGKLLGQFATLGGVTGTVEPGQFDEVSALLTPAVGERADGAVPPMPSLVPAAALPDPEGSEIAIGVDADHVIPVRCDLRRGPVLVAGRGRTGRSSVLRGLTALARRSPLPPKEIGYAAGLGPVALSGREGESALGDLAALHDWVVAVPGRLGPGEWALLVIDDAHLFDRDHENTPPLTALAALLDRAGSQGVAIIAASDMDDARTRGLSAGIVATLKRSRRGLLLNPDGMDGSVLGVTVPMHTTEPVAGPGRGFWCADGRLVLVHAVTDTEEEG